MPNNIEKVAFYASLREKVRALTWTSESMMISVHMVESQGWGNDGTATEGVQIEAAPLTFEDIERAYREMGMEVYSIPLRGDVELREGYEGMVLVIARPIGRQNNL